MKKESPKRERKHLFTVTIKDCEVSTYRGSGPGGQHRNKTATGVRIKHVPSGAVAEDCTTRSQLDNKRAAWGKLVRSSKFQIWCRTKALGLEPVEEIVERLMQEENLKVEYGPF